MGDAEARDVLVNPMAEVQGRVSDGGNGRPAIRVVRNIMGYFVGNCKS